MRSINRNDVVVFNFPAGDTIINLPEFGSKIPYYDVLRSPEYANNREKLLNDYPILVHPVDKTDNYIKRCVGIPGDIIQVKGSHLWVNGAPAFDAPYSQTEFIVQTNGQPIPEDYIQDSLGININEASSDFQIMEGSSACTEFGKEAIRHRARLEHADARFQPVAATQVGQLFEVVEIGVEVVRGPHALSQGCIDEGDGKGCEVESIFGEAGDLLAGGAMGEERGGTGGTSIAGGTDRFRP